MTTPSTWSMPKVVEAGSSIAFLSFALDHDEAARQQFISELSSCTTPLSVDDWSRPPQSPRSDWQKLVQDHLGRSHIMIILVSKETATAPNVANEITLAKTRNVPFFGVYIDGADATTELPAGLPRNRTIPRDWSRVSAAIAQLRKEGKHHVFV